MDAVESASGVVDACAASPVVEDYDLDVQETVVVRPRLLLSDGFIDVYRNVATGREGFARVRDGRRVFGADNTGGWHRHPLEDPESHVASEPVTVEAFLAEVEKVIQG